MVALVKGCLRNLLGNAKLNREELLTTLVEIEGTLNSRSLTYVYDDEVIVDVLTPSHLIFGRRLASIPDKEVQNVIRDEDEGEIKRRFRYLARLRTYFWSRWRKEYLTNLREYHKVGKGKGSSCPKRGDVVLVFDEGLKRRFRKTARIERLVVGKDDIVRGAEVRVVSK
ncbi:uncharacterized protein LOC124457234 [Xenia sp. Carnegie-2017]|uniref:uncharacterized protein LOC124457234 n=1 Tax=Xenia sp. Carnegie-2017 TaxID=2897299 RepID=UPI001F03DC3F|nr:uncharacterized protein LOC124457234 [Xenia sp. Carnegie-2017]